MMNAIQHMPVYSPVDAEDSEPVVSRQGVYLRQPLTTDLLKISKKLERTAKTVLTSSTNKARIIHSISNSLANPV